MVQQHDPELRSKLGLALLHNRLILKSLAKLVLLQRAPTPSFGVEPIVRGYRGYTSGKRAPESSNSPGLDGGTTEGPRTSIEAWVRCVAPPSHPGEVGKAGSPLREVHPLFWRGTFQGE